MSAAQSLVAEAEFYACNRGTAVAAGSSAGQAQAGSGIWRSDTCGHRNGCRKMSFLPKAVPADDNVADLMTKHLAAVRVEELLLKLGGL